MSIDTVCICGAGTMGSGIAQVSAVAGYHTVLYDVNTDVLDKARTAISNSLQTRVQKGRLSAQEKEKIFARLLFTNHLQQCIAGVVIEAIVEKPEIKTALFNQLAQINHSKTIFVSNTSSLSITALGRDIIAPERFAGLHFFNPAPVMKLVEVVKGHQTDESVVQALINLTKSFDKTPVLCKDAPGFIVNRVARPYYIEALRLVEEGLADVETIDRLLESRGFKLGPFRLMDLIGNDVNYAVSLSVWEQLGKPERLKPSSIQKEKVAGGEWGRKTKKGYYNY